MPFGYDDLQAVLTDWPNLGIPKEKPSDSLLDRICQVLSEAQRQPSGKAWHGDLLPLIRHYLLRESDRAEKSVSLRVPAVNAWPREQDWGEHGVEVLESGQLAFLLTAQAWHPEWLGGRSGVFADAYTDHVVRRSSTCEADPFIRDATGFATYSSSGQREAVRAAFLMLEGDTLFVNLPTGSGKSLVGQAPSLVHKEDGHLTIFVVPTVALALDQARAMQQLFQKNNSLATSWPLAWYGGLSKEDRSEIRRRLQSGTQRILFASPEALTTSLLGAVSDSAARGMLQYFVIDEAHLVTQWGDEFRPSFQALAGLRNSLLKRAPRAFRTILMSATWTEETADTLANLFGPRDRVQMVSAVHLRPEPQYWFYKASGPDEKQLRVLQALRHAPRPFILYVTKREEVHLWRDLLRQDAGLKRLATFHGGTPNQERLKTINDWAANKFDGIVATSAFGVGLDKNDVRTVVHATIPETLDRYYQEVGRGGRDGKPSVSLLVFDNSDWNLPEQLARPKIISNELGFDRWKAMYESRRVTAEPGLWSINVDAVRDGLQGGSEQNVNWNMRTLILMVRAGLISLEVEVNLAQEPSTDPEEAPTSMLAAMANVGVRILNDGHLIAAAWESTVKASRDKTLVGASRNLNLMKALLPNSQGLNQEIGKEVGATLADLYRIRSSEWPVHVTHVCGGCPKDRFGPQVDRRYAAPHVAPIYRVPRATMAAWREKFPWVDPAFVNVFYDETQSQNTLDKSMLLFAEWLVRSCGMREISVDPKSTLAGVPNWQKLYRRAPDRVLLHRSLFEFDLEPYSPLARLTILTPESCTRLLDRVRMLQRPFHVVFLPIGTRDPQNGTRRLFDITPNALNLDDHLVSLTQ